MKRKKMKITKEETQQRNRHIKSWKETNISIILLVHPIVGSAPSKAYLVPRRALWKEKFRIQGGHFGSGTLDEK